MTTAQTPKTPLDLAAIRSRLSENRGPQYWRSLEELANTDEFQELLQTRVSTTCFIGSTR